MTDPSPALVVAAGVALAIVIGLAGTRLTRLAEECAIRTGWGQALVGLLLLGAVTSLPGLLASVTAAANGNARLAASNAFGGIAAQTLFLTFADVSHREANLEHAAASVANLVQCALLLLLGSLTLVACLGPNISVLGMHPVSLVLPLLFLFGGRLVFQSQNESPWHPEQTLQTRLEPRSSRLDISSTRLGVQLLVLSLVVGASGVGLARTGEAAIEVFQLDPTLAGNYLTAIVSSLPELVTVMAAARRNALNLAVADIVGGNCFDTLFIAASDAAYRPGSIYHALSGSEHFLQAGNLLLTAVLALGLLRREKHGIGNIGFESVMIILIYIGIGWGLLHTG